MLFFNVFLCYLKKAWDIYAKAYYLVAALKMEKKLTPKLFRAIQDEHQKLTSVESMVNFLVKEGVIKNLHRVP